MFEQRYTRMNDHIHPGDTLIQETLIAASHRKASRIFLHKRWAVALLCLVLLLATGTAIAANFDFAPLLERWFPDTAKNFTAVNLSDSEQGVTLTALQANLTEDGHVEMLLDISGEGITPYTVPMFSWTPYAFASGSFGFIPEEESFDAPYTYLYRVTLRPDEQNTDWFADDGLMTLTMAQVTLGRQFFATIHDDIDLAALPKADLYENPQRIGGVPLLSDADRQLCLTPGNPIVEYPHNMALTAIGFIPDGRLAIQWRCPVGLPLGTDAGSFLVPVDSSGEDFHDWIALSDLRFWTDEANAYHYTEEIYDLTADDLSGYKLRTYCYTVDDVLEGDWTLTIDVNDLILPTE